MKRIIISLMLLAAGALCAQDASKAFVTFANSGDPADYFFTLAKDFKAPRETGVISPIPRLAAGALSQGYEIDPGDYYICGSYAAESPEKMRWGYNNAPNAFQANTEYLVLRITSGEGYKVLSRFREIPTAEFIDLEKRLDSPEKISEWMLKNIKGVDKYGKTVGDQSALRTAELKTGNCVDMSGFAYHMLRLRNPEVFLLAIQLSTSDPRNHVVCVFKKDGKYYQVNNGALSGPFKDFVAIALKYEANWWRYLVFDDFGKAARFEGQIETKYRK